jgi:hypothetical protein
MAEIEQLSFSYQEVLTALIKEKNIHEGIWQLVFNFGIGGANVGENPESLTPVAIVAIASVGIGRVNQKTNLCVDAAEVNPAPSPKRPKRRAAAKS